MRFPIFPEDLSQMPKKGVVTASSLCQKPPSAGKRRWTSFDVKLVFQLRKAIQFIAPHFTRDTEPTQSLPNKTYHPALLGLLFNDIVSKVVRLTYLS
jgi:hypothetical protein